MRRSRREVKQTQFLGRSKVLNYSNSEESEDEKETNTRTKRKQSEDEEHPEIDELFKKKPKNVKKKNVLPKAGVLTNKSSHNTLFGKMFTSIFLLSRTASFNLYILVKMLSKTLTNYKKTSINGYSYSRF